MYDWLTPQGSLYLVTPPGGPRPARVEALADFLSRRLALDRKGAAKEPPKRDEEKCEHFSARIPL